MPGLSSATPRPKKTSKFPMFLGGPFCSPVPPRSFIFPPVFLAPPLNNGILIFLSLDIFFCIEISFFPGATA